MVAYGLICFCRIVLGFGKAVAGNTIPYGNNKKAGHYADVNGIKLYYEEYGKGVPLLMLHGNGRSLEAFHKQMPFFEKYYRVIAIDRRLKGKLRGKPDTVSYDMMADDFCSLLSALKIDSAYVSGWSDGGINGLIMAMRCPVKIIKLAVSGANTVADSTAQSAAAITEMKNFVANDTVATPREKTLTLMMLYRPDIAYSELSKIICPVLVMTGDHDLIKLEHALKIFQSIKRAQLNIFSNSNQRVCQQHPKRFNKTVFDFFKGNV